MLVGYIATRQSKKMNEKINKRDFDAKVISGASLSLVQFKEEWNGACQIVSMIYEDLARSYEGSAAFFTVDMETNNSLAKQYGVTEVPAILFFRNGKMVDHVIGLIPKNALISKIENALYDFNS